MKSFILILLTFFSLHAATITTNKATYNAGESITVTLSGVTGQSNNWVGLFPKNAPNSWGSLIEDNWFEFKPNGTLTLHAPNIGGEYEARLFYNDSLNMVKKTSFTVNGAPLTLATDKLIYNDGETITVTYHNVQGASNNWIGLFPKDSQSSWDTLIGDGKWLNNRDGSVTFTAPQQGGDYEVRIFYNDSLQKEKTSEFTVNKVIVPRAPTMYEDAEDGLTLGWYTTGGPYTAKNIYARGSRIIHPKAKWVGDHYPRANEAYYKKGDDNGNAWNNTDQFILDFDTIGLTGCMTYGVEVRTLQGSRSINFSTWFGRNNYPPQKQVYSDGYVELTYAIPVALRYAGRHHVRYDLNYYLKLLEPDNEIIAVDAFHCSGYSSGAGVDNIRLLSQ